MHLTHTYHLWKMLTCVFKTQVNESKVEIICRNQCFEFNFFYLIESTKFKKKFLLLDCLTFAFREFFGSNTCIGYLLLCRLGMTMGRGGDKFYISRPHTLFTYTYPLPIHIQQGWEIESHPHLRRVRVSPPHPHPHSG